MIIKPTTLTVNSFLKHFYEHHISKEFTFVEKVFNFSDGSASQYKNFKNLINLFHHEDFNFRLNGTFLPHHMVKILVMVLKVSCQCKSSTLKVEGVTSFFVESDTVIAQTECLESQFAGAKTFKGTRSHHRFIPSKKSYTEKDFKINLFKRG